MLRAEKELEREINALMRRAEILDAQEDKRYGKRKLGSDLPDELRCRQDRQARIRQARKEIEAEAAAATARQRQEEAEDSRARAAASREADALAAEQAELCRKAQTAEAKAKAAREKAIEVAQDAGLETPNLDPRSAEAMRRRGLARRADGTPARKTQRNFIDSDSHLMKSGGSYLQGYNCQLAVDSDHQVIVAVGVSKPPLDVEHLANVAAHRDHGRCTAGGDDDGWGLLERVQRQGLRRSGHRRAYRHRPPSAWRASSGANRDQRSTPSARRS